MSEIIEKRLSNGIRAVIEPRTGTGPLAIGLTFNTGSRYETEQEGGLAHLLEHNIFNGTHEHTSHELVVRAADMGSFLNAYTASEMTNYHLLGMAQNSGGMIDLLGDIVLHSQFPEEDFVRERITVVEEIKQGMDNHHRTLSEKVNSLLYPSQPLGRSILGTIANISAMPRDVMTEFFQENYHTGTLIVSIAGDIDPDKAIERLEGKFGSMRQGTKRAFHASSFGDPTYDHVQKGDMNQTMLSLVYRGLKENDAMTPALLMGSSMLGGGMDSRLFQEVRVKRSFAYSVYTGTKFYPDTGSFGVNFSCSPEKAHDALMVAKDTLHAFAETMTEQELKRAKEKFRSGITLGDQDVETRMNKNGFFSVFRGHAVSAAKEIAEIDSVALADVRKTIGAILETKPTLATVGPQNAEATYSKLTL